MLNGLQDQFSSLEEGSRKMVFEVFAYSLSGFKDDINLIDH